MFHKMDVFANLVMDCPLKDGHVCRLTVNATLVQLVVGEL